MTVSNCQCSPPHRMSKCHDCGVVRPECDTHYCEVPGLKAEIARLRGEAEGLPDRCTMWGVRCTNTPLPGKSLCAGPHSFEVAEAGLETPGDAIRRVLGESWPRTAATLTAAVAARDTAWAALLAELTRERDEARAALARLLERPTVQALAAAEARVRALEAEIRAWAEAVCAHSTGPDQIQRITGRVVERRAALDAKPCGKSAEEAAVDGRHALIKNTAEGDLILCSAPPPAVAGPKEGA